MPPILGEVSTNAAALGDSVSAIFNQQVNIDHNQRLKVAQIISNDPGYNQAPTRWIKIFNISTILDPREHGVSFVRHRPSDFPTIKIKACPKGDPWVLAVRVGNIVHYKLDNSETGQPSFTSIRGERFATDLINPANLSDDMWRDVGNTVMSQLHGGGDDLSVRGVFWTWNDEPS